MLAEEALLEMKRPPVQRVLSGRCHCPLPWAAAFIFSSRGRPSPDAPWTPYAACGRPWIFSVLLCHCCSRGWWGAPAR